MKSSLLSSCFDDLFDSSDSDIFDGAQPEADTFCRNAEADAAFIDIRRQDVDSHFPAVIDQHDDFIRIRHFAGQRRRHIFCRIMGFKESCLVGENRICNAVRFIETVGSEFFYQIENVGCGFFVNSVFNGAVAKFRFLTRH